MPTFKLPAVKKKKKSDAPDVSDMDWRRRITIPANQAIIKALKVGDAVDVKLTGKVIAMASNEHVDRPSDSNFEVEVIEVSAYSTDGSSEEDFKEGYDRD